MASKTVKSVKTSYKVNSTSGVNLRKGPGLQPICVLQMDTEVVEVPIAAEIAVEGWVPVTCEQGSGWVMAEYLTKLED